jgi:NAD(P)-dependent dehydrogenase (short-subunit alcohol dehydrogenase family)
MELPRRALVVGATGGLGAALCEELEARGAHVLRWSRSATGLELTDEGSIARAAAALEGQTLDWLFVATGMLAEEGRQPERRFAELDAARMAQNYAVNAIGPALLIKHLQHLLPRDRPAAVAALSARLGSIGDNGLGGWMSYRAAKAGLNQLLRCASVELRRKRPQAVVVGLHPGTVDTPLTRRFHRGRTTASAAESARQLVEVVLGLGPEHSGRVFDYAGLPVPF